MNSEKIQILLSRNVSDRLRVVAEFCERDPIELAKDMVLEAVEQREELSGDL